MGFVDPDKDSLTISIHALLAESDTRGEHHASSQQEFLSTLSLRRATGSGCRHRQRREYFYPRSPCGERLHIGALLLSVGLISIHALLAESDDGDVFLVSPSSTFLSTLSLRRATWKPQRLRSLRPYFYPRSPCGERPSRENDNRAITIISIHALLAESDRQDDRILQVVLRISIHALLAESDRSNAERPRTQLNFYPRSPCGERRSSPTSPSITA